MAKDRNIRTLKLYSQLHSPSDNSVCQPLKFKLCLDKVTNYHRQGSSGTLPNHPN